MSKTSGDYDYAVHSDFLIHWTGKDIDQEHDPDWAERGHRSITSPDVADLYIRRLHDILAYGLWMTEGVEQNYKVGSTEITVPATPQCSFTELRLSDSRKHAKLYGRLGIGVKRPFLFQRFGRPLTYFWFEGQKWDDRFLAACSTNIQDKRLLNFFKPMNSEPPILNYDLYSESEWRSLYFDELLRLDERKRQRVIDPRDGANEKVHAYFNTLAGREQEKLKYLIPLDGWFSMLIYPSALEKNRAQWDTGLGIRKQIARIKSNAEDHGNQVEGLKNPTRGNWPIEIDLDACRNV